MIRAINLLVIVALIATSVAVEPVWAGNASLAQDGVPYTRDDNGNPSAGSGQALLSDGVRTFEYGYANRLIRVVSGTLTTEYTYNGDGLRVGQSLNGQGMTFTWDVAAALPQVLATSDGAAYLYGLGLLAQQQSGAPALSGVEGWQYPLPDGLGSLRHWTDVGGQVTYAARYAPFGSLLWQQGTAPAPWGFAGEMQDPTGLLYLRARWYDPTTGRFLTRDPFPGLAVLPSTQHPYVYALNNPVLYTDPSGEFIVPLLLAIGASAAIGGVGGGVGYALAHPGGRPEDYLRDAGFRRAVGVGALSGAVAGGVGFGVGGLVAGLPGLGGAVLGGALTGAAASGVGQVTTNLVTPCVKWNTGLGQAALYGAVSGGIAGGVGYGIRRLATPSHPVNNSLPFRDPALRQQVGNVIESMDVAGNPPPGVRQGGARVNGQRMPGLYRGEGLPSQPLGYYTETDVWPGLGPRGSERLVFGNSGEVYYTPDHYHTFIRIR